MKRAIRVGFCFGIPSGIITTLGLMVGLNSSTQSQLVVIGGILTIAIADSMSDAMGIHISQESENHLTQNDVWKSTFCTFIAKFMFSIIFIFPILIFSLKTAIIISILIGIYLIFLLSLYIARERKENPLIIISEHILITILVVIFSNFIGLWVSSVFG